MSPQAFFSFFFLRPNRNTGKKESKITEIKRALQSSKQWKSWKSWIEHSLKNRYKCRGVRMGSWGGGGGGGGAGIAQWLERRTRDWKVAGSNPCWNGGRIFFSRVDFLCWLLFRYPFHPRVTTVARKRSRSFCQKCRWQVTAKHAYILRMWLLLNRASALVTTCP